jgi:hypothetical protein
MLLNMQPDKHDMARFICQYFDKTSVLNGASSPTGSLVNLAI